MTNTWLAPLKELVMFLSWWMLKIPQEILRLGRKIFGELENVMQFWVNFRLWLAIEPLFGDYTLSGRITGFLMRGLRMFVTLGVYIGLFLIVLAIFLAWYLLPVVVIWKLFNY
ncbi:MAG: hypothetical protein U9M89_00545 [Patescibacteria group bacterium]|nr:hypothetical protein [Patescibacteria group bacterium]